MALIPALTPVIRTRSWYQKHIFTFIETEMGPQSLYSLRRYPPIPHCTLPPCPGSLNPACTSSNHSIFLFHLKTLPGTLTVSISVNAWFANPSLKSQETPCNHLKHPPGITKTRAVNHQCTATSSGICWAETHVSPHRF